MERGNLSAYNDSMQLRIGKAEFKGQVPGRMRALCWQDVVTRLAIAQGLGSNTLFSTGGNCQILLESSQRI